MDAEKVELKLLNTMTQVKEVLKPINPGKIGIYLKHLGYEVTYVRNFTDVDDKVIDKANECGVEPLVLSNRFCEEYLVDMGGLQCLLPTHQPRVSDHMEHIVKMIEKIIENECGYVVGGDVFFSVDKSPDYGRLSGQRLDHTQAGKRVAVDPRKRNPADFALWKAAKPGEPSWESPWGAGRPGWHIECSAMSAHYLSPRFDIHGGGIDLKFPHHENETAQTCAACEDSGVNYWLHNGHVTVNDEKMAKSLKNFKTIREITAEYHPLALRHFLMSAHYRSDMNFSISQLEISSDSLYYIYQTLQDFVEAKDALAEDKGNAQQTSEAEKVIKKVKSEFEANMSDDLNTTPILTGAFQDAMKFINVSITKVKIPKDMQSPEKEKKIQEMLLLVVSLLEVEKAVRDVLDVLGLLSSLSYAEFLEEMKQKALVKAKMSEEEIMQIIEERRVAKRNKKWTKSDEIRKTLAIKGISLMDIPKEDTVGWRPCIPPQSQTNSAEVNATPESESTPLA